MNQEQIRILIDALAASELSELEYSQDGCSLRLVKHGAPTCSARAGRGAEELPLVPLVPLAPLVPRASAPTSGEPPVTPAAGPAECVAPLHGVIHLQPAPGEPPFVRPGQPVAAGQTLCVIEAMKVFNEVRAEADATIVEALVRSGDEVEAGQPLFRLA